jgi:hypothetical protein
MCPSFIDQFIPASSALLEQWHKLIRSLADTYALLGSKGVGVPTLSFQCNFPKMEQLNYHL